MLKTRRIYVLFYRTAIETRCNLICVVSGAGKNVLKLLAVCENEKWRCDSSLGLNKEKTNCALCT